LRRGNGRDEGRHGDKSGGKAYAQIERHWGFLG
jgi:hypothetical protein